MSISNILFLWFLAGLVREKAKIKKTVHLIHRKIITFTIKPDGKNAIGLGFS